jgi:hypothetical protein
MVTQAAYRVPGYAVYDGYCVEVDPVFQEFVDVLTALAGAHAFTLHGIELSRGYWEEALATVQPPTTADSTVFVAHPPGESAPAMTYSKWRLGDLPGLLRGDGPVLATVSRQWVVSVYAEWEEHYRPRITKAIGLDEPLKLPPFGDLRLFRHDIVHNRGIASSDNSGKAEVFTHWFRPGDVMTFDTGKVAEFMAAVQIATPLHGVSDTSGESRLAVLPHVQP